MVNISPSTQLFPHTHTHTKGRKSGGREGQEARSDKKIKIKGVRKEKRKRRGGNSGRERERKGCEKGVR